MFNAPLLLFNALRLQFNSHFPFNGSVVFFLVFIREGSIFCFFLYKIRWQQQFICSDCRTIQLWLWLFRAKRNSHFSSPINHPPCKHWFIFTEKKRHPRCNNMCINVRAFCWKGNWLHPYSICVFKNANQKNNKTERKNERINENVRLYIGYSGCFVLGTMFMRWNTCNTRFYRATLVFPLLYLIHARHTIFWAISKQSDQYKAWNISLAFIPIHSPLTWIRIQIINQIMEFIRNAQWACILPMIICRYSV